MRPVKEIKRHIDQVVAKFGVSDPSLPSLYSELREARQRDRVVGRGGSWSGETLLRSRHGPR